MSLVQCRYNPNHRMKLSKREIHEQKCPDRFTCKKKLKHCPYDPLELIEEDEYEEHLKNCKSRPKITAEEEESIKKAQKLNDITTEREKIQYARQKYYKGCVEEPEIPGLVISKKQKKKNQKKLKAKFTELNNQEANRITEMAKQENEDDDNDHEIKDFAADLNFELEKEDEEEKKKKNFKKLEKYNEEEIINSDKSEIIKNNKKEDDGHFYEYDPNEEDKDIGKFSANIIVPAEIYAIIGK